MTVYSKTADTGPTAGFLDEWMVGWHDRQADSSVHRNIDQHQVIRTLKCPSFIRARVLELSARIRTTFEMAVTGKH
ncbi:hypothetical protein PpBr36_01773 [Pyricularia pennisetigena]|uniref:hypothetical protein n=1 Tax=Pyricularia pennisetigena TaxID=1578925 RepID=UPI001154144C|nr:hypothetical protein PpBr36_01773 [Pyricularia pennisetigena]TLS28760.1 hypothetical protein PpBr36_01773 [Pyricularia pennisetigena]